MHQIAPNRIGERARATQRVWIPKISNNPPKASARMVA
jgi:hypothetical protein